MIPGPLEKDAVIGGRYKITGYIGAGGMQHVYSASDTSIGRVVALKTPQNNSATKRFKRSAVLAAKVNHPHVAKTLDYIDDGGSRYLIEEFIEGEDLSKSLLARSAFLDPHLAARILHHLARGIAAAHHVNVIHRDLKPSNIMVRGGYALDEIKVTDFGIARLAGETLEEAAEGGPHSLTLSATAVGALPYMAPEAIETPKEVTSAADIWSLGAMMFHIITGLLPFGSGLKAVNRIIIGEVEPHPAFMLANAQFAPLASELLEIVATCLKRDPTARPTADQLVRRCETLCYAATGRQEGKVRQIRFATQGFIEVSGRDTFFHMDSVYGERPVVGDSVVFASYGGGGAPRAHPVVKIRGLKNGI